jgi:hypothetical protein
MRKAISTAGVILLAILSVWLRAAETAANEQKAPPLKTRAVVYRYSEPNGTPLAPSSRGEPRIDVLQFLKWNTPIVGSPGAEAVWFPKTRVLATKLTDEDYTKLKETLLNPEDSVEIPMLELTLSVWEFRLDPDPPSTFPFRTEPVKSSSRPDPRLSGLLQEYSSRVPATCWELRKSSRTLLRKIHSQTLVTLSGRAVAGVNGKTVLLKDDRKVELGGRMGSAVRCKPVIGADHLTADFHVDYDVRIPSTKTKSIEISDSGDYTLFLNEEVLAKTAMSSPAKEETLGYWVGFAVRIHAESAKARAAADAAAVREALEEMKTTKAR